MCIRDSYLGGQTFNARRGAGNFSPQELQAAVQYCHTRGVKVYMTLNTLVSDSELPGAVAAAGNALDAGVDVLVVSNHGGRVLDQCPATAEVLPEIAAALKGTGVKVLVDGGIRTGVDVFKALALGADGVLICRPFVTAVYGGGAEGVKCYIDKLAGELADTMQMCGAHTLAEITPDMVRV